MVDVSTCYFPETTWIIKNSVHSTSQIFDELSVHFLSHKNLNVNNDNRMAQFSMFNWGGGSKNCYATPMTEENCASFEWLSTGEKKPTLETRLASLFRWLSTIFNFLLKLFKGEISLGGDK